MRLLNHSPVKSGFAIRLSTCLLAITLSACGSSSSDSDDTTNDDNASMETTYTGVFVDSAVEGLNYETATQSGITNSAGEFIYQQGETVTFSIGGISFPAVEAKIQLSPLDVFATTDYSNTGVVNMARLLQSLDVDGMADNGIELASNVHTLAANLSVDFTSDTFDQDVAQLLIDNNAINISLIDEQQAIAHLTETITGEVATTSCGSDHAKVGFTGNFSTNAHDVTGDAEIIDNCTIRISNFYYDGQGPEVFFYGAMSDDFTSGFSIGDKIGNGVAYQNETITLTLPNNKSLDDLNNLSVWCVDFDVSFGDLTFTAP